MSDLMALGVLTVVSWVASALVFCAVFGLYRDLKDRDDDDE